MDLFGDLPEPTQTRASAPPETKEGNHNGAEPDTCAKRRASSDEAPPVPKRVCTEGLPTLRGFASARRGERDEMQDAHVLLPDMSGLLSATPKAVSRLSYFAVFDGHGGARASRFAAENLHLTLAKRFPTGENENPEKLIKKSLVDAFKQTDEDFLKKASSQKPAWKDGSTATCALVVDNTVYVANLGDSRAVLCRMELSDGQKKPVTLCLSKEHNPTMYEERMRIQRAGGSVREGRVLGVLEVSRSLGDGQYKRCGVISTPDLRRCQLTHNDRFMILACDGLFKVFSAEEAVKFVLNVLEVCSAANEQKNPSPAPGLEPGPAPCSAPALDGACQQLASEAVRRGCADNVTVILVSITFPK
ncbi:integrin-linked kinase-associated serine/threonine phosphatase 2C [Eucyclogobius newberryi]|uniref:integrin-linked kinase-associated serine/threonine phosphatase 2C n=1 Tax=Eucyclogobius newberryi TaxID=166745 RepID=UPI003B594E64